MSTSSRNPCLGLIAVLQLVSSAQAERVDMLGEFEVHRLVFTGGEYTDEPFQYLVLPPHGGAETGKTYPLVLFLHGAGERGDDPQKLLIHFPTQMAEPEWREKFPCFLVCRSAATANSG